MKSYCSFKSIAQNTLCPEVLSSLTICVSPALKLFDGTGSGLKWQFRIHIVWQLDRIEAACVSLSVERDKSPSKVISVRSIQSSEWSVKLNPDSTTWRKRDAWGQVLLTKRILQIPSWRAFLWRRYLACPVQDHIPDSCLYYLLVVVLIS